MGLLWRCISRFSEKCKVEYLAPHVGEPLALFTREAATKAKGKAAAKAAPAKKKNVIKKKPRTGGGGGGGGGGGEQAQRVKTAAQSCLEAPTPLRYLKEKDRLREMEREKLGLISKERQKELDMEKEKKKQDKQEKPATDERDELDVVKLGVFEKDEIEIPSVELTVEEGRRLAKEYSKLLMRDLRKRQAEETIRLQMKIEAIAALPPRLREAARVPDLTPFPPNRHRAYLTPPVEDYDQKLKDAAKQQAVRKHR